MKSYVQILKAILTLAVAIFVGGALQSCSTNKISSGGSSVYANPDSIQYTAKNYIYMLKYTYANFEQPVPKSALSSIENAPDDDAAKEAYNDAIDDFVDSGASKPRWENYFRTHTGAGDNSTNEYKRYPEHLFASVMLSGKPISELLLAQYAIDDTGNKVPQDYTNGPATSDQAGYFTMASFLEVHMNQFMFRMVREVIDFNLCDTAPYTKAKLFGWTNDQINEKYTESGGIQCISCHQNMNPIRGAFHNFDQNRSYQQDRARNQNQYASEPNGSNGSTLEPKDSSGDVMDEDDAENTMFKLTDDGAALRTPRDLAKEIVKNERYGRCMVERMFSVIFNLPEGHNGINYVVPNNYAENEAQTKYLDEWTEKFEELNQVPKDFLKAILKDKSYLVISYNPND